MLPQRGRVKENVGHQGEELTSWDRVFDQRFPTIRFRRRLDRRRPRSKPPRSSRGGLSTSSPRRRRDPSPRGVAATRRSAASPRPVAPRLIATTRRLRYRLVAAALAKKPPTTIWWPWQILPWSRELLAATLPGVALVAGVDATAAPEACRGAVAEVSPVVKEPQWRAKGAHAAARAAAYAVCGVNATRAGPWVVRVLERADAAAAVHRAAQRRELCRGGPLRRRIRDVGALEAAARSVARRAGNPPRAGLECDEMG